MARDRARKKHEKALRRKRAREASASSREARWLHRLERDAEQKARHEARERLRAAELAAAAFRRRVEELDREEQRRQQAYIVAESTQQLLDIVVAHVRLLGRPPSTVELHHNPDGTVERRVSDAFLGIGDLHEIARRTVGNFGKVSVAFMDAAERESTRLRVMSTDDPRDTAAVSLDVIRADESGWQADPDGQVHLDRRTHRRRMQAEHRYRLARRERGGVGILGGRGLRLALLLTALAGGE